MNSGVVFCPFTICRPLQYFSVRWWPLKRISSFLMIEFFSSLFHVLFMDYLELPSGLLEFWQTLEMHNLSTGGWFQLWNLAVRHRKPPKQKRDSLKLLLIWSGLVPWKNMVSYCNYNQFALGSSYIIISRCCIMCSSTLLCQIAILCAL